MIVHPLGNEIGVPLRVPEITPVSVEFAKFALVIWAPESVAPVRFAPTRLAPVRFAPGPM